ncbi:MAG: PHP domain-containing protein, partial [Acidimicrobiia bacterium]
MDNRYAELHCHTNFSFLDGASHPEDLVERAVELGYQALAVTDHDGFYGAVRFSQASREAGLPAVYGVEIGLSQTPDANFPGTWRQTPEDPIARAEARDQERTAQNAERTTLRPRRGRNKKMHGSKPIEVPPTDHLILLAGSPAGYRSLSRLVTTAQFRGEKDRPVYLWADLIELAKTPDIVALSGCHSGEVPGAAARGDLAGAMSAAIRLRELFGRRFHLELWHHGM